MSADEYGKLASEWEPPNSLIKSYDVWSLDQEAKDRLDATIYFTLALATYKSKALDGPSTIETYPSHWPKPESRPSEQTSSEASLPLEYWTPGDYITALDRAGVRIMLAPSSEMDVWLARATKQGWPGMMKMM
ncbi:hypothetical protein IAR50_003327 [Cryptococcus sp. DSM 104548]